MGADGRTTIGQNAVADDWPTERTMADWPTRKIAQEVCRVHRDPPPSWDDDKYPYVYELHDELNRRGHYWDPQFIPDDENFMATCLADAEMMGNDG